MDFRILIWGFTALFVYLKLVGHVDWSWWLVLSPLLLSPFLLALVFTVFAAGQEAAKKVRK